MCKKFNDDERVSCCFLTYDIQVETGSKIIGTMFSLAYGRGLSISQLFDNQREFEFSTMLVFNELFDDSLEESG